MELSKKDAYLVLRTAYKTGLMSYLTKKPAEKEVHIPGTSVLDTPGGKLDFVGYEKYSQFLAELIDTVRKEEKNADVR